MDKHEKFNRWWKQFDIKNKDSALKLCCKAAYTQGRKDAKEELDGSGPKR